MSSKGLDPAEAKVGEVKLAPGWMSLGRKTRSGTGPAASPLSTALPRVRISKAEMLEVYEPGAPPGLPPIMTTHNGITCVDSLVPINIAPDDELLALMSGQSTSTRTIPRGSPSRSTSSLSRHRLAPSSPPAANGRTRIGGSDELDRAGNFPVSSLQSAPPIKNAANHSTALSAPVHGTGSTAGSLSSSAYNDLSTSNHSSSGAVGTAKRSGATPSNRDFWSNSGNLASVERSANSATGSGERRPLALKPRSAHLLHSDGAGTSGQNGTTNEHQNRPSHQGSGSYWSRSTPRGSADADSNWRGGSGSNNSTTGNLVSSDSQATSNSKSGLTSSNQSSSLPSSRSAFGRDVGRDTFSRNKEALKPTNTRDLSALAKGSTRDTGGSMNNSSTTHYGNRDKEYRAPTSSSSMPALESRGKSKHADLLSDPRDIWYYKDPRGAVQGPFNAAKVMNWLKEGYYDDTLEVSRNPETGFAALAVVFGLRKEPASTAAPPGFLSGNSVGFSSTADDLGAVSDRSEPGLSAELEDHESRETRREQHAEPKKLTVKEMEEEVEKMRLENHRKKHLQLQKEAQADELGSRLNGPMPQRIGFFDGESSGGLKSHVDDPVSDFVNDTHSDPAEDVASNKPVFGISPSDSMLAKKDVKQGSISTPPLSESRFASLMSGPKVDGDVQPAELARSALGTEPHVTNVRSDIGINQVSLPGPASDLRADPVKLASSSQSLVSEFSKKGSTSVNPSQNSQSLWGTGVAETQQRTQSAVPVIPGAPIAVSGHDLMAMDPAIARASFTRRPAESSNPAHLQSRSWTETNVSTEQAAAAQKPHVPSFHGLDPQTIGHLPISGNAGSGFGSHSSNASLSLTEAQVLAHAQAQNAQAQAHAQARARAQAHAQAQAQAQARAHAQAAHVQAQARARAVQQAAHVQAQVRAQTQAAAQAQSAVQNPDPLWMFRHQLAQLQTGWDLHCRGQMEASRSLQHARQAANNATPGSIEHQQAEAYCSNCEAVIQEHTLNMERIKAAAQTTHAQMLRHQQQQKLLSQQQEQLLSQQQASAPSSQLPQSVREPTQNKESPKGSRIEVPTDKPDMEQLTATVAATNLADRAEASTTTSPDLSHVSPPAASRVEIVPEEKPSTPVKKSKDSQTVAVHTRPTITAASLNESDESGWETVERKTRTGSEEPQNKGPAEDSKLSSQTELPSYAHNPNLAEPTRGPVDSHVLVVPADKDPRKLAETASDVNRRDDEADDSESMRRKVSSIPAPWIKAAQPGQQNGPSLREIQRQEELRSKAEMDSLQQAQREQTARQAAARQAAAAPSAPWGSAASKQRTLSLREQMRLEEEQKERNAKRNGPTTSTATLPRAPRPSGTQTQSRPAWASLVASNKPNQVRQAATVVGKRMEDEGTFWETVGSSSRRTASATVPGTSSGSRPGTTRTIANRTTPLPRATRAVQATAPQGMQGGNKKQTAVEPTNIQGRISSEMAKWCSQQLRGITGESSDDNTFAEYLASLKSEDEIRDTVLQNLGANDMTRAFAEEFIRRLAFEKLGDASEQTVAAGGVGGGRKRGRRRQAKVDPSLFLNFSSASSQRIFEKPMD